jgi:hypothetical protein
MSPKAAKRFQELLNEVGRDLAHPEVGEDFARFVFDVWDRRTRAGLRTAFRFNAIPSGDGWNRFGVEVGGKTLSFNASPTVSVALSRALKHIGDGDFDEYL